MMRVFIFSLVCLWSIAGDAKPSKSAFANAVAALRAQIPKFQWQVDTAIAIDINADGIDDVAVLGYTKDTAAVGVVLGGKNQGKPIVSYMDFGRGDGASVERAMSGRTGTLVIEKQADISEEMGALPEGYQICDQCFQIEVASDEESDPMYIYWNHVTNSLDWWRE